jgi:hypothetical protein
MPVLLAGPEAETTTQFLLSTWQNLELLLQMITHTDYHAWQWQV